MVQCKVWVSITRCALLSSNVKKEVVMIGTYLETILSIFSWN